MKLAELCSEAVRCILPVITVTPRANRVGGRFACLKSESGVLCCLLSLACLAVRVKDAAIKTIRPEAIRAHVEFLTDDLLEGRGTGTRGYELAAKYVAAQFEAMGLEPAGLNKSYFQPIRFRSMVVVPGETSIKLTRNGIEEALVYGQDYYGVGDPRPADIVSEWPGGVRGSRRDPA